jgi:hypothetical protein
MNQPVIPQPAPPRRLSRGALATLVRRFARWVRELVAEFALAQRRLAELATAPDRYLIDPDTAPETYAEFLFRTSGLLRHEPPARASAKR